MRSGSLHKDVLVRQRTKIKQAECPGVLKQNTSTEVSPFRSYESRGRFKRVDNHNDSTPWTTASADINDIAELNYVS
jgi:hypothetical protein